MNTLSKYIRPEADDQSSFQADAAPAEAIVVDEVHETDVMTPELAADLAADSADHTYAMGEPVEIGPVEFGTEGIVAEEVNPVAPLVTASEHFSHTLVMGAITRVEQHPLVTKSAPYRALGHVVLNKDGVTVASFGEDYDPTRGGEVLAEFFAAAANAAIR